MSPFWISLELRMMEVVSGENWSYKTCKAPVKSSPPSNQHPAFWQAGCPSCCSTNSVEALKGNLSAILIMINLVYSHHVILTWCMPPAGSRVRTNSGIERIDSIHFLALCRKRQVNQALSIFSLIVISFSMCFWWPVFQDAPGNPLTQC